MAFTRAWDESFPPDTQAANQLGLDIRQEKEDTRQRIVAFAAGRLVDRETPEAVWGDINKGVLFFALDEGKAYRWNGVAWVDVTASIGTGLSDFNNQVPITVTNPAVDTDGISLTSPANTLAVGSYVEIFAGIRKTAGTPASTAVFLLFGGTTIAFSFFGGTAPPSLMILRASLVVTAAATQVGYGDNVNSEASFLTGNTRSAPTANIAADIIVKTRASGPATYTTEHEFLHVRVRG